MGSPYGIVHSPVQMYPNVGYSWFHLIATVHLHLHIDGHSGYEAVTPRTAVAMLPGGLSSSACGPIWEDSAWPILGIGNWLIFHASPDQTYHNPGFALPPTSFFSSHHHKIKIFTFWINEQSRQRTEPISYYVQIQLSPGCIIAV